MCQQTLQDFNLCMFYEPAVAASDDPGHDSTASLEHPQYLDDDLIFKIIAGLICNIHLLQKLDPSEHISATPQFEPLPDNLNITEGQLQSSLATVTAFVYVNKVKVENCNCSYVIGRIVPENRDGALLQNTFEMNSVTGEITLMNSVDREASGNSITLTLLESDYGTPPKTETAILTIKVVDVNDESPKFNTSFLELNMTESLCTAGRFLYNITAHDADSPPNNVVVYSVRQQYPEQQLVTIDNSSGQLSFPCSVQNDTKIIATVKASDSLDLENHNSVDLRINALAKDPNPHPPVFMNSEHRFSILSFFALGSVCSKLRGAL